MTRTEKNRAWVKTQRSSACESCASHGACTSLGGGKDMEVETLNDAGAAVGDRVQISFDTSKLMGVSFLVYIFPILLLIAGAMLGEKMAPQFGLNESVSSALGGFGFFGLAFVLVRWWSRILARKRNYQPRIQKILV